MSAAIEPDDGKVIDGDWICSDADCKNLNFARRTQCNRCHRDRDDGGAKKKMGTEIGKAAAEKSRGLFSAEDWQCSKCANVNWARRQTCNMCNAPKFCAVEERTGYGGGYNDRGVVEYKERQDSSDDEYDEFGRRKKPRTAAARADSRSRRASEEDSRSDSDDEGGGDLSKYDLWGSDSEEVNEPKTVVNQSNNHRSKASRSTSKAKSRSRSKSASSRGSSTSRSSATSSSRSSTSSRSSYSSGRSNSNTCRKKSSSQCSPSSRHHRQSRSRSRSPLNSKRRRH